MNEPTIIKIGIGRSGPYILYKDPVFDTDVYWDCRDEFYFVVLSFGYPTDLKTVYTPQHGPLLNGFRKYWKNKEDIKYIGSYVKMLWDSGYNILTGKDLEKITLEQLDKALRERPDLFQRDEVGGE